MSRRLATYFPLGTPGNLELLDGRLEAVFQIVLFERLELQEVVKERLALGVKVTGEISEEVADRVQREIITVPFSAREEHQDLVSDV